MVRLEDSAFVANRAVSDLRMKVPSREAPDETKATDCIRKNRRDAGRLRGEEAGTSTKPDTEQERPVLAAHVGQGGSY